MKKIIKTTNAPEPIGPYSQAVEANGLLFVSGQIAINPTKGDLVTDTIEREAEQVMKNLGAILQAAGYEFSDVVKCTILLSDMELFGEVNRGYGSYFKENPPARETFAAKHLPKYVNVEISCIASKA